MTFYIACSHAVMYFSNEILMPEIEVTYLLTYLGTAVDCSVYRSSHPEVFPGKGVLKICMQQIYNFIEIAFRHGCSRVNLLHIFRTSFLENTSGRLLLCLPNLYKTIHCFTKNHLVVWFLPVVQYIKSAFKMSNNAEF